MKFEVIITFLSACTLLGSAEAQSRRVLRPVAAEPVEAEAEPEGVVARGLQEPEPAAGAQEPVRRRARTGFRLLPRSGGVAGGRGKPRVKSGAVGGGVGAPAPRRRFRLLEVSGAEPEPARVRVPAHQEPEAEPQPQPRLRGLVGGVPVRGLQLSGQEPAGARKRAPRGGGAFGISGGGTAGGRTPGAGGRRVGVAGGRGIGVGVGAPGPGISGFGGPVSGGAPAAGVRVLELAEAEGQPLAGGRAPKHGGRPVAGGKPRRILGLGGAPVAGGRRLGISGGQPVRSIGVVKGATPPKAVPSQASRSKPGRAKQPAGGRGAAGLRSDMQQLRRELRDIRRLMKRLESRLKRTEQKQRKGRR